MTKMLDRGFVHNVGIFNVKAYKVSEKKQKKYLREKNILNLWFYIIWLVATEVLMKINEINTPLLLFWRHTPQI